MAVASDTPEDEISPVERVAFFDGSQSALNLPAIGGIVFAEGGDHTRVFNAAEAMSEQPLLRVNSVERETGVGIGDPFAVDDIDVEVAKTPVVDSEGDEGDHLKKMHSRVEMAEVSEVDGAGFEVEKTPVLWVEGEEEREKIQEEEEEGTAVDVSALAVDKRKVQALERGAMNSVVKELDAEYYASGHEEPSVSIRSYRQESQKVASFVKKNIFNCQSTEVSGGQQRRITSSLDH